MGGVIPWYNIAWINSSSLDYKDKPECIAKMWDFVSSNEIIGLKAMFTRNASTAIRIIVLAVHI